MATSATVFQRFTRDDRGVIAMLFALVLVPVMLSIGLAIDYGHASAYRTSMQKVLDEAVVVGAMALARQQGAGKAQAIAQRRFNATGPTTYPVALTFTADEQHGTLTAEARATVPTTFMGLAGMTRIDVHAKATATSKPSKSAASRHDRPARSTHRLSDQDISDVIDRVERLCHQLRQMTIAIRVPQCQAVYDGSFAERLRRQLAATGTAGNLLPGGVRLVE